MSYAVEFDEDAGLKYASWQLAPEVEAEVDRCLESELAQQPAQYLYKLRGDIPVMQYVCEVTERSSPPIVHIFHFRVRYSLDEKTLIIWDCFHYPLSTRRPPQ